jgi:chromatin segregation and condensation protein Rec8/ScpA/Scc1 (kleisin family)
LFQKHFNPKKRSKLEVVTAFFAVLELARQNRLRLRQKKLFGGLYICRKEDGRC